MKIKVEMKMIYLILYCFFPVRIWDIRPFASQERCTKIFYGHTHNFEKVTNQYVLYKSLDLFKTLNSFRIY